MMQIIASKLSSTSRTAALIIALLVSSASTASPPLWQLRADGAGPLEVGMSLQRVAALLDEPLAMPADPDDRECFYVQPKSHSQFALMFVQGSLRRIDIHGDAARTATGIAVGDPVARVKATYGPSLVAEPHFYVPDEQYLTAFGPDKRYAVRFETERGNVSAIYAGFYEQVQYVEGCA